MYFLFFDIFFVIVKILYYEVFIDFYFVKFENMLIILKLLYVIFLLNEIVKLYDYRKKCFKVVRFSCYGK